MSASVLVRLGGGWYVVSARVYSTGEAGWRVVVHECVTYVASARVYW